MIHPHLKSTRSPDKFARLLTPAVDVRSNKELYAAVYQHGAAVIVPFEGWGWQTLPPVTLTPQDFEREWQGD